MLLLVLTHVMVAINVAKGNKVGHCARLGLGHALLERRDALLLRVPRPRRVLVAVPAKGGRAARPIASRPDGGRPWREIRGGEDLQPKAPPVLSLTTRIED